MRRRTVQGAVSSILLQNAARRIASFSIRCSRADDKTGLIRPARTFHDPSCRSRVLVIGSQLTCGLAATVHNKANDQRVQVTQPRLNGHS